MATFPNAAKIQVENSGTVKVQIGRPRPYYCRGDTQRLVAGEILVVVVFTTPLKDANWIFSSLQIWNKDDDLIDIPDLIITGRTAKSASGFTVKLSAPPLSDNFYLDWAIAERYNP